MKKVVVFAGFCLLGVSGLHAQNVPNPNEYQEEAAVLLKNEYTAGVNIHSYGWGLIFRRGKNVTVTKKRFWEGEFVSMKHPKEIRSVNPYVENAKSYIFGKLNTLLIFRGGYGRQRVLFDKAEKGGVAIRLNYGGGFSLGITKPIYLNILVKDLINPYEYHIEAQRYDPERHQVSDIYGRASFTYGMTQLHFYPGLYLKTGLSFEYSKSHEDIKSLEVGMAADIYGQKIPIMAFTENKEVYFIFYINLLFGRRWK